MTTGCVDQELLLEIFREENLEGVRYHQDGVILKGNAQDDKRNFTGSLMLVQRAAWNTSLPGARICYLIWIPYSYLFCLAPHLVSPAIRRVIDTNGDLPLLDRRDASSHISTKIEWMYTMCIPLTRIARMQRKSNLRGKRIVTCFRVGGGVECPLIFQDGGMTKLFDELKRVCTVRPVPNSADEFAIEDRGEIEDETTTSTASLTSPAGRAATQQQQQQSGVAGSPTSVAYVDPQDLRKELYSERPPATSAAGSPFVPASPGVLRGSTSSSSAAVIPLETVGGGPKKSMMSSLINFGANLTQKGTKLAGTMMASVADLAKDEPLSPDDDFEVVSAPIAIEDLVPKISHLTQRKAMKPRMSRFEWELSVTPRDRRVDPSVFLKLRDKAFLGGIDESVRADVWTYLLRLYPVGSTATEREAIDAELQREYSILKQQWMSISEAQEKRFSAYRERKSAIEKDVIRTDRFLPEFAADDSPKLKILHDVLMSYAMYNFDLGYCQGMSDVCSIFVLLYEDEWKAWAMFRQMLAEKCEGNFRSDVKLNMEKQLLAVEALIKCFAPALHQHLEKQLANSMMFCFRWLLILFKREFDLAETLLLWDVLLSSPPNTQFEVFVTAALLRALSGQIVDHSMSYDELLKFANKLPGSVSVSDLIIVSQEFYDVVASQVAWRMRLPGGSGCSSTSSSPASPAAAAASSASSTQRGVPATSTANSNTESSPPPSLSSSPSKPTLEQVLAILKGTSPPASPITTVPNRRIVAAA